MKGDGRVVGVVGEAGIGKSRLCFEFAESCRQKDIRVYEARVLAHGRATPFQPVLGLLRDYFGLRVKSQPMFLAVASLTSWQPSPSLSSYRPYCWSC